MKIMFYDILRYGTNYYKYGMRAKKTQLNCEKLLQS